MRIFAGVDWEHIHNRIKTEAWYANIVSHLQNKVDAQLALSLDVPAQSGGWVHRYVSPQNWIPLIYDSQSPDEHFSSMGDSYNGEPFDGAWRVWRHRELATIARDAGLLYHITSETRYMDAGINILQQYAGLYLNFGGEWDADHWMLKGRAMNQALTEALWACPLILAYDLIGEWIDDVKTIRQKLIIPISETLIRAHDVLIERGQSNHNYVAWLLAALACIGFTLDDTKLIERVIDGEGGFKAHINSAILADGFEYEATPYYHNFVALAYIILAIAAQANKRDLYQITGTSGQSIARMWRAFSQLVLPDGTILEANDGSYWQNSIYDPEICEVYEVAYAHTSDPLYGWLLHKAYERRQLSRSSWAAVLFAKSDLTYEKPQLNSQLLRDSGFAVLHNKSFFVAIPFGDFTSEHSHYDRLSLNFYPFSLDAGTPLYGVEERRTWYQQTLAHNTVIVDGQSQEKGFAKCMQWSAHHVRLMSDNLYAGVILERETSLSDHLLDVFTARSEHEHTYEWLFHSDSVWNVSQFVLGKCDYAYAQEGAGQYIHIVGECHSDTAILAETQYGTQSYLFKLTINRPFQLLLADCPGRSQAPYIRRHMLIVRTVTRNVRYEAEIMVNQ